MQVDLVVVGEQHSLAGVLDYGLGFLRGGMLGDEGVYDAHRS